MDIEKLLIELENIIEKMEDKDITLNYSLELLEQGVKLTKQCFSALNSYKGKLIILKESLDGLDE
ncbi:MAG: exodeoxyribonuclease VII small subunit [Clostridia bacterium]